MRKITRAAMAIVAVLALSAAGARGAYERQEFLGSKGSSRSESEILKAAPGSGATAAPSPAATPQDKVVHIPLQTPAKGAMEKGQFRITSETGYLDFDQEANTVYGPNRTKIEYGDSTLEADKAVLDLNLKEAQCEGNVVLKRKEQVMRCDALRFNFADGMGAAYNAKGDIGPMRFKLEDRKGSPSFQQVSESETLLRKGEFTTCDFPIPMYSVKAKEVIILKDERVLMRSAVLKVRGVPVMYLPMYSRSLKGRTPWFWRAGMSSKAGAYFRLGYTFQHRYAAPGWEDEKTPLVKSRGSADVFMDYFSKHGFGGGVDYRYRFGYDKHIGQVKLNGLSDSQRDIEGEQSSSRWQAWARHRSQLTHDTTLQVKSDMVSDPELYYDMLDSFEDVERGRIAERQASGALTVNHARWIARVRMDVSDRISKDRFRDFSDPKDDDLDLDVANSSDKGISSDRWGRTSLKAPEINLATNDIRLGKSNFYYAAQVDLYNSLDHGLNLVDSNDDAWVQGGNFYNSIKHVQRFSERTTWTNKFGVGAGMAQRGDMTGDLVDGSNGFAPTGALPIINDLSEEKDEPGFYDGVYLTDPNTFHNGLSPELKSFDDVNAGYGYADWRSRLTSRFTDALSGYAEFDNRVASQDSLGDWYASQGNQFIRQDVYNYPVRKNWVRGGLAYSLFHPNIRLYNDNGYNLNGDLYPNERQWYNTVGAAYTSDSDRFSADTNLTYADWQYYNTSDPRAFTSDNVTWSNSLAYRDPSQMWWAKLASTYQMYGSNQLENQNNDTLFDEGKDKFRIVPTLATRIGPKWTMLASGQFDTQTALMEQASFSLNRDLHDALLALRVRIKQDVFDPNATANSSSQNGLLSNLNFSFTVQPKLPRPDNSYGLTRRSTIDKRFRQGALEEEG